MPITRFVSDWGTFVFPSTQQSFNPPFANVLARASRLPGTDGFDEFGTGWAPAQVANLTFSFILVSQTLEGMQPLRDAVNAMRGWGVGQLFFQPVDTALSERFCFCRVNNISMPQKLSDHTDRFQTVELSLQVVQPYWHTAGTELLWGSSWKWDDGSLWDSAPGAPAPTSITTSGTMSVTVGGNVFTLSRILVINDGGSPAINPIIRRILNGEVADEVRYFGTIAAGDWLEINPRAQRVLMGLSGADVIENFDFLNPDWMRLYPGSNSLQIYLNGTAKIAARYLERVA